MPYQDELRRHHTDPATGLAELLKKDHDAALMVVEATTFSSYGHTITDVGNIILGSGSQERAAVKVWGVEELRQQDQFFYK